MTELEEAWLIKAKVQVCGYVLGRFQAMEAFGSQEFTRGTFLENFILCYQTPL